MGRLFNNYMKIRAEQSYKILTNLENPTNKMEKMM